MAAENNVLKTIISTFQAFANGPEVYLNPSADLPRDTAHVVKVLFDFAKRNEPEGSRCINTCPLQKLLIEDFDDEQIWQEIELQNEPVLATLATEVRGVEGKKRKITVLKQNVVNKVSASNGTNNGSLKNKRQRLQENEVTGDKPVESDQEFSSEEKITAEQSNTGEDLNEEITRRSSQKSKQRSVVDDKFFKLADMLEFLDKEDRKYEQARAGKKAVSENSDEDDDGDNDSIDLFADIDSEDEEDDSEDWDNAVDTTAKLMGRNTLPKRSHSKVKGAGELKYADFFDPPEEEDTKQRKKKQREKEEKEGESEEGDGENDNEEDKMEEEDTKQRKKKQREKEEKEGESEEGDGENDNEEDKMEEEDTKQRKKKQREKEEKEGESEEGDGENDDEEDKMEEDVNEAASDSEEHIDDLEDKNDNKVITVDTKGASTFEKNQQKLKQKIEKLEKANLSTKPWQMSGETTSKVRPLNSLLAEDLEFDHTTVAAPAITEESTKDLESIVKQRIKDEAWDDVERKTKPAMEPYEYKKRKPLDQEKSKLSLSQIYEQEYLKQTQNDTEEKESEEHKEIKVLMSKLFVKLDALSNFHFTPKPVKPELKVVTNAPAISMEEVAPVAVSDAMLLAPEEIQEKTPDVKGDTEKTATDRKHDRRLKKKKQRMRAKEKEKHKKLIAKANPGLGNKHSKQAAMEKLEKETKSGSGNVSIVKDGSSRGRDLATSSAFFSRLQDEVKEQLKTKMDSKKRKAKGEGVSAPRLKL